MNKSQKENILKHNLDEFIKDIETAEVYYALVSFSQMMIKIEKTKLTKFAEKNSINYFLIGKKMIVR